MSEMKKNEAAPAAVAVPDSAINQAMDAMQLALSSHGITLTSHPPQDAWVFRGVSGKLRDAIAALAATPAAVQTHAEAAAALCINSALTRIRAGNHAEAIEPLEHALRALGTTTAAAAPVVLPEPVGWRHSRTLTLHETEQEVQLADGDSHAQPLFTEQQVRALLATATGLPAQADMPDSFREWFAKNYPADTIIVDPNWHAKSIFRMAQAHARLAAPQAQADARDAERYRWLRSRDLETICQGGVFAGRTPQNVILNEEDLDEAVDAAIAAQAAQGGE